MVDADHIGELVEKCQQGQTEDFGLLVRHFQNAGYAVALSHVHDSDDAKDVLQDAFVTAFCRLGQLRDPAAFGGWFRSIVVSQARGWLRQRRLAQRVSTVVQAAADAPRGHESDPLSARLANRRIWEQVWALPEPSRCAALLHYLSGFSEKEIAAFLQVPVSTVHGRLQQSRLRLRSAFTQSELEEVEMSSVDVTAEMEDLLYQLASEPVREVVGMSTCRQAVLFCGAKVDVEVESTEGDDLILEGNRVSMGLSPEAARQSARAMQIKCDQVDDFGLSGPHEGEVFGGTHWGKDGKPVTYALGTGSLWQAYGDGLGWGAKGMRPGQAFPALAGKFCPFPEELKTALTSCCRISVVQPQAQALVLPTRAYQPRLHKVFRPNWCRPESLHGPVGYVSLMVRLPRGRTLTVVNAASVVVRQVEGRVFLVDCWHTEADRVNGDLFLLNSPVERVSGLQGRLYQRCYSFGGMNWHEEDTWVAHRAQEHATVIEDLDGAVDIEVGKADLELKKVRGAVSVMNRYGRTRLVQREPLDGSRYHLESVSGLIEVAMEVDLLPRVRLAVVTLCGTIDQKALAEVEKDTHNSMQLAALATKPDDGREYPLTEAQIFLSTECGEIRIQRLS
ncbi:MAG: RNA polymerase sigma factor [Candidatus Latescibacterota bacterium]|jgi:RNA polymerase sigma factor (sigma-70 family)